MARIIIASYMVRFPLGGYLSWMLQWLAGFHRLGHDVYFVERSQWRDDCFDPSKKMMTDDCRWGTEAVDTLLKRFDLAERWCFVDIDNCYHGLSRSRVEELFQSADLFIDMGPYGAWLQEAANAELRVFIDCEPGDTQMKMENGVYRKEVCDAYDHYYSVGSSVGTATSTVPTVGKQWRPIFDPVVVDFFPLHPSRSDAPFNTVMSWQAHQPTEWQGTIYGQKDVEFEKFMSLPRLTATPMEIAVAGEKTPVQRLRDAGWRIRDAHAVTLSFDSFLEYVSSSRGEFSVCKNVFVATHSGFFSERSAAYLASGRPVVMQDTGFSAYLPCGRGLFAVRTVEEAAAAITEIQGDYARQSRWARELALEHLDTAVVLPRFLHELGL